ncbi:MAG: citryl-CoA lyase [Bauldia sp.]
MLIGKPGPAKTAIATADAAGVEVRGRDLAGDLMGRLTFTEFFHLLMTGREPTRDQRFFLDLLLVAIAEHGLTPTVVAARMTYDAAPGALQAAVAAGILGCGTVILGTAELCGAVLTDALGRVGAGGDPDAVVAEIAGEIRARGDMMPGFGHPLHKPVDPRAERILALADERKIAGRHVDLARRLAPAVERTWGRRLPMNVSMPIAACLLDLDFPAPTIKAIPILARTAGLLAHLAEEQERPIGFLMAAKGEEAIAYDGGKNS